MATERADLEHDGDPDVRRVEAAQVAAELQDPRPVLLRLDVAVELADCPRNARQG